MITGAQCRTARAALSWSQADLAQAAGTGVRTIVNFERGHRLPQRSTLKVLHLALLAAGIEFIDGGARLIPEPIERVG